MKRFKIDIEGMENIDQVKMASLLRTGVGKGPAIAVEIEEVKESKFKGCLLEMRKDDPAPYLLGPGGDRHVLLDGYAVVPKEQYLHMSETLKLCKEVIDRLAVL